MDILDLFVCLFFITITNTDSALRSIQQEYSRLQPCDYQIELLQLTGQRNQINRSPAAKKEKKNNVKFLLSSL